MYLKSIVFVFFFLFFHFPALADQQVVEDENAPFRENYRLLNENDNELYARALARGKAWNILEEYDQGDTVSSNGSVWISLQNVNTGNAVADGVWWTEVSGGDATDWTQADQGTIHASNYVDADTHINQAGVEAFGFVTGGHTVDTDTHLTDTDVGNMGYIKTQSDNQTAADVPIADSGGYYTGAEVETALQEAGSATAINTAKDTYPSADSTKVGFIGVTQAVNLDTVESDTETNNSKITYPGDELTTDQQAAVDGAATPTGANAFATMADVAGHVTGPLSATDNAVARFDATTGKVIQDSSVTIDDSGNVSGNSFGTPLTGTSHFGFFSNPGSYTGTCDAGWEGLFAWNSIDNKYEYCNGTAMVDWPSGSSTAAGTSADTSNFNNNLSSADDTVQKALATMDNMVGGAGWVYTTGDGAPVSLADKAWYWDYTNNKWYVGVTDNGVASMADSPSWSVTANATCSGYTSMDTLGGAATLEYEGGSLWRSANITTGSTYSLGRFSINLIELGTAVGDVNVTLRVDNAGLPGTVQETFVVTAAEVAATETTIALDITTPFTVSASDVIHVTVENAAGSDSSNMIALRYESGGRQLHWSDDGSAWSDGPFGTATITLYRCD